MMREFIDDDEGFLAWLESHANGYVINTTRNPTPGYLMLHRAECRQLRRQDARQIHMTRDYIKICAPRIADLEQWATHQFRFRADLRHCPFCKP